MSKRMSKRRKAALTLAKKIADERIPEEKYYIGDVGEDGGWSLEYYEYVYRSQDFVDFVEGVKTILGEERVVDVEFDVWKYNFGGKIVLEAQPKGGLLAGERVFTTIGGVEFTEYRAVFTMVDVKRVTGVERDIAEIEAARAEAGQLTPSQVARAARYGIKTRGREREAWVELRSLESKRGR